METLLPQTLTIPSWLAITLGGLLLVAGWLLYWASVNLLGALILGGCGVLLGGTLAQAAGWDGWAAGTAVAVAGIMGGLCGALLARILHALVFFAIGAAVGASVFFSLTTWLRSARGTTEWFTSDEFFSFGLPVAGLLMAIVCVVFSSWLITICTALLGAALVASGLDWPFDGLLVLPLLLGGLVVQGVVAGRKRKAQRYRAEENDE